MESTNISPYTGAVITAGGEGLRMGLPVPKQFHALAGKPILVHAIEPFQQSSAINTICLVLPEAHLKTGRQLIAAYHLDKVRALVSGSATRQGSVRAGIAALPPETEFVIIHDAARPFVTEQLITSCLTKAMEIGAAIVAAPVSDTIKKLSDDGVILETVDRRGLWRAQTPQAARLSVLREAYTKALESNAVFTDEASIIEHGGFPVGIVPGTQSNMKITEKDDLQVAEAILATRERTPEFSPEGDFRIGHGFDAHRLVKGRPLVLGGIVIPHGLGLLGHSDADVLIHALCDALLGALGDGDLGCHFPDTDMRYKDVASTELLSRVTAMMTKKNWRLTNADITLIAERPKLAPHIAAMRHNLATFFNAPSQAVNIKATTTEKMGFTGREEGIAAHAVVLLRSTIDPL